MLHVQAFISFVFPSTLHIFRPVFSSLVSSSPAPWSSAVNSNNNASGGGFWDDAAPPPGLNNSNSTTPAQSNKNKKKTNSKEAQKNNMKTAKEDAKVAQIFRENSAKTLLAKMNLRHVVLLRCLI